jgi:hypothetical protein
MARFSFLGSSLILILFSQAVADDPKTIPLDQIWGYELPGTRNIRELEPKRATGNFSNEALIRDSRVLHIYKALHIRPKQNEKAGPAFAVVGTGEVALKNAHEIILTKDKQEPPRVHPAGEELSLVFYSYMSGRYVRLVNVRRTDRLVEVDYRIVSHLTSDSTVHFALIPLGKFPPGAVHVRIQQVQPVDDSGQPVPLRDERNIVCDSFTFSVDKR